MTMRDRLERLARAAAGRPALTLGIVLALALGGGALALGLRPSVGSHTFVSRSSPTFKATDEDHRRFGGDAVVILIRESLPNLVETSDLGTLAQLEACLAGQVVIPNRQLQTFTPAPPGAQPAYGGPDSPRGTLMKEKPVQVVYGPGTFLSRAVAAVQQEIKVLSPGVQRAATTAARRAYTLALGEGRARSRALADATAAAQLATAQQENQLAARALQSGITQPPTTDDPQFISQVVFDSTRGVGQPKARFSYLFPTADSALIQVRLKASLTDAEQAQAISWIRQAVAMPMFRSTYGGTYTVSGVPVVLHDLASEITGSIAGLLIAVLVVMAATLLIVFRRRLRLLPLAIALAATGVTFGGTSLLGGSLTMASIAVLPILIGLAVDYGIQFQSRVAEARREQSTGATSAADAAARAAARSAPTIAPAALAPATGFLL